MLGIIEQSLKIIAMLVGDKLLAKWIGAFYLFMRRIAEPKLREEAERQFQKQSNAWEVHKNERQSIKRDTSSSDKP
mgnify:CR=1 FL=1